MFKLLRLVSVMISFLLAGSAFSASTAALNIQYYDVHPHQQRLQFSGAASLGYPVGDAYYGIILDCKAAATGAVRFYRMEYNALFIGIGELAAKPDAALGQALQASGLVSFKGGVLTIKKVSGLNLSGRPLVNSCKNGILTAELRDGLQDNEFILGSRTTFYVPVAGISSKGDFTTAEMVEFQATVAKVSLDVDPAKGGFQLSGVRVNPDFLPVSYPNLQVLISDGRALYPLFYNGDDQTNSAAARLFVAGMVSMYVTLDGTSWLRTDLDLKMQRTRTQPASKPNLPIKS